MRSSAATSVTTARAPTAGHGGVHALRDLELLEIGHQAAAQLTDDPAQIAAQHAIARRLRRGEEGARGGDAGFDRRAARQQAVAPDSGAALAADRAFGGRDRRARVSLLFGPRVLARRELQSGQRLVLQARHFDVVGDHEALAARADEQAAAAVLAAAVDAIRSAARQPREVRLRVEQDAAQPPRGGETGEALDLLVDLMHGGPS